MSNTADAWRDRANRMLCATCMSFASKTDIVGRCRRHCPTMNGYPVVFVNDWCGDHKLNELMVRKPDPKVEEAEG